MEIGIDVVIPVSTLVHSSASMIAPAPVQVYSQLGAVPVGVVLGGAVLVGEVVGFRIEIGMETVDPEPTSTQETASKRTLEGLQQ